MKAAIVVRLIALSHAPAFGQLSLDQQAVSDMTAFALTDRNCLQHGPRFLQPGFDLMRAAKWDAPGYEVRQMPFNFPPLRLSSEDRMSCCPAVAVTPQIVTLMHSTFVGTGPGDPDYGRFRWIMYYDPDLHQTVGWQPFGLSPSKPLASSSRAGRR
jgi:hypothetical protein